MPFKMDLKQISPKSVAVIAAISQTRGVEIYNMHPRSINTSKFLVFVDDLRRKRWGDDIALFVDRLSVHRSNLVKERLEELSIPLIFNASYEPNYMPIENVFARVKANFRRLRLDDIAANKKENIASNISKSFDSIDQHFCIKCIRRANDFLAKSKRQ